MTGRGWTIVFRGIVWREALRFVNQRGAGLTSSVRIAPVSRS